MSARFRVDRDLKRQCKQQGISLVELLVSMAIALLVLAGVVQTFLTSKQSYLYNEQLAFIQENARFAIDRMSREIREAGYFGCPSGNHSAVISNRLATDFDGLVTTIGMQGFEGGVSTFPSDISADVVGDTDALIVRRGMNDNAYLVINHTTSSVQARSEPNRNFQPAAGSGNGTVWIIASADCNKAEIFAQSGGSTVTTTTNADGKSTQVGSFSSAVAASDAFPDGSELMQMSGTVFYIAPSSVDANIPALYQRNLRMGGTVASDELVMGVDDLQIEYGLDDDGNGRIERYVTANQISDVNDWSKVGTVRIQLVFRSQSAILPEAQSRQYLGVDYNDRFLRQVVSSTVQIRNFIAG